MAHRGKKPLTSASVTLSRLKDGEGYGHSPSGAVSLFGTLPGEQVRTWLGKRRRGQHPGWLAEVEVPHPHRVEARCPHFGTCGGCLLQHLDSAHQIEVKSASWLAELARRSPAARLESPVVAPNPYYYRTKVEFSFSGQGEALQLGFNRRGRFDRLVGLSECFIGPPENRLILERVGGWARRHHLAGWDPRQLVGFLRYLVVRRSAATGDWLAVLVSGPGGEAAVFEELARELSELGARGVLRAVQTSVGGAVNPDSEQLLAGRDELEERLGPLRFKLNWRSFFQVNPPAYLQLLETARRWCPVGAGQRVLDLFCGIGTIGLFLSPPEAELTGVESVAPAIESARANALLNARQARFECAPAENWTDLNCDLLVLDPPRGGCHPKLLERLRESGPEKVLYISCNPKRLLEELSEIPYQVERAQVFDFFPQTRHYEALLSLRRRPT